MVAASFAMVVFCTERPTMMMMAAIAPSTMQPIVVETKISTSVKPPRRDVRGMAGMKSVIFMGHSGRLKGFGCGRHHIHYR